MRLVVKSIREKSRLRLQALPGQNVTDDVRVSSPRDIRDRYQVGSYFEVWANWVHSSDGRDSYLRTDEISRITEEQAREILASRGGTPWPTE